MDPAFVQDLIGVACCHRFAPASAMSNTHVDVRCASLLRAVMVKARC